MSESFIIGTRGSELALFQADATERALHEAFPELALKREIIRTTGDRRTDVSLSEVARTEGVFDKGVFIKELEMALHAGEIDLAVHSMKDVPTVLEERFAIAAVLERAPIRDVLLSRTGGGIDGLPEGAVVGTSSPRRARQLEWLRPDVKVVDLRGNVPTRLEKLAAGDAYDAILLAEAGLIRLGFLPLESAVEGDEPVRSAVEAVAGLRATRLPESVFYPAAGQGAIGFEIRASDSTTRVRAEAIGHRETWLRIVAEREFLRLLDAGCHTPVGVYSALEGDQLRMHARVFPEAGGTPRLAEITAPAADPLAAASFLFHSLA